ncbi:DUF2975 domain-containing protein [Nocardioides sp. BP30]|uniref:DUF2975 domain-containing protein n=1 Tax=Nocardioides sp. BP30 TaxID=3036374 RepID=UPI002468242A|nr:DUF2975 domain-containing protein [Nocardioides sp. BP30]WGL51622.1 DUF2975 domain-containing protein [Nocardioides sp. BP30]
MAKSVVPLKAIIAAILAWSVLMQVLVLPWTAGTYAARYPEFAWMRSPLLVISIVALAVVEFGLLGVWQLLTFVSHGILFSSPAADRWVTREIGAVALVTALGAAMLVIIDLPLGVVLLPVEVLLGAAAVLLVVVLRGLLRAAATQHHELESVV